MDILRTLSQLYLLYTKQLFPATCYCAAEFYTFLLAININIEPIDMVTSLLLYLHHAVTALILNLRTVGKLVLFSRPRRFNPWKDPGTYWVRFSVNTRNGLHDLE